MSTHVDDFDEAVSISRALRDAKGPENGLVFNGRAGPHECPDRQNWRPPCAKQRSPIGFVSMPIAPKTTTVLTRTDRASPPTEADAGRRRHLPRGQGAGVAHRPLGRNGAGPSADQPGPRTSAEIAEERRLLYVAITRAERELHCHWASERAFGDRAAVRSPSPYLNAILSAP